MAGTQGLRAQMRHSMHDVNVQVAKIRPAKSVTAGVAAETSALTAAGCKTVRKCLRCTHPHLAAWCTGLF